MNVAGRCWSMAVLNYRHDLERGWAVDFDGMRYSEVQTRQFIWHQNNKQAHH